jgi:hypothetical protein
MCQLSSPYCLFWPHFSVRLVPKLMLVRPFVKKLFFLKKPPTPLTPSSPSFLSHGDSIGRRASGFVPIPLSCCGSWEGEACINENMAPYSSTGFSNHCTVSYTPVGEDCTIVHGPLQSTVCKLINSYSSFVFYQPQIQ